MFGCYLVDCAMVARGPSTLVLLLPWHVEERSARRGNKHTSTEGSLWAHKEATNEAVLLSLHLDP